MITKRVKLIIRPDGSCTVDAVNFADASCTQATQQILQALAAQITREHCKAEAQCLPPRANPVTEAGR